MKIKLYALALVAALSGCYDDEDYTSKPPAEVETGNDTCQISEDGSLACDGGYSWWNDPLVQRDGDLLAFSGVSVDEEKSTQWVSIYNTKTKAINTKVFDKIYLPDEHNTPAIKRISDYWLVSVMGHNEPRTSVGKKIFIYKLDDDLNVIDKDVFKWESPLSYTQILSDGNDLYFGMRDMHKGWGVVNLNDDNGLIPFKMTSLLYPIMHISDGVINMVSSYHPKRTVQDLELAHIETASGINRVRTDHIYSPVDSQRLLNAKFDSYGNGCAVYSEINDGHEWELSLVTFENGKFTSNEYMGNYVGVLGYKDNSDFNGKYVLGADIVDCKTVVVATESNNGNYEIVRKNIYGDEDVLFTSNKLLYRPIVEGNVVMFNEADYWFDYTDYKTTQHIKFF
ncbi:hypothetical protein G5C64_23725 [Vibrio diabolicus]|nr:MULTISPECIES: hypothetical protein [Vibrio]MCE3221790.1 hypothetical protein [Vibrio diabolicus]MDW3122117.1 hypothetical protein [Vibrio sp. 1974]